MFPIASGHAMEQVEMSGVCPEVGEASNDKPEQRVRRGLSILVGFSSSIKCRNGHRKWRILTPAPVLTTTTTTTAAVSAGAAGIAGGGGAAGDAGPSKIHIVA